MALRVLLVDDHEVVRAGLRSLLDAEDDIEVAGEAGTVEEALTRAPALRPDVAVLDLRIPGGDGITLCRELRSRMPNLACLILTSYADEEAMSAAVLAGASGYVLKQVLGSDLVADLRQVGEGKSLLDPKLVEQVIARMRRGSEEDARLVSLTGRERKILDLIAEGLTNRQIADRLYLAEKTVKNYVSNLLSKLGMQRRTEAAVYAARLAERRSASQEWRSRS
jgi:two-component system, NarL family, response regulator DevR